MLTGNEQSLGSGDTWGTLGSVLEPELVNTIILFILSNRGADGARHAVQRGGSREDGVCLSSLVVT